MECNGTLVGMCVTLYKLQSDIARTVLVQLCFRLVNAKSHFDLVELFGLIIKIKY